MIKVLKNWLPSSLKSLTFISGVRFLSIIQIIASRFLRYKFWSWVAKKARHFSARVSLIDLEFKFSKYSYFSFLNQIIEI